MCACTRYFTVNHLYHTICEGMEKRSQSESGSVAERGEWSQNASERLASQVRYCDVPACASAADKRSVNNKL